MTMQGKIWRLVARAMLAFLVAGFGLAAVHRWGPASVRAAIKLPPPFDFNDDFYAKNGIDISKINNNGPDSRVGSAGAQATNTQNGVEFGSKPPQMMGDITFHNWLVDDSNTDPTRNNVRVPQTTGGFDQDGNLIYYSIMATLPDDTYFTQDTAGAGARALGLANSFHAFIFPKQLKNGVFLFNPCPTGTAPTIGNPPMPNPAAANCVVIAPQPVNRRQDNLFETRTTYFCGNLLGLWILEYPVFTPQINTPQGQAAVRALIAKNGFNLDGTPVFKTLDQINQFVNAGFVQLMTSPNEQHQGFDGSPTSGLGNPRYVV